MKFCDSPIIRWPLIFYCKSSLMWSDVLVWKQKWRSVLLNLFDGIWNHVWAASVLLWKKNLIPRSAVGCNQLYLIPAGSAGAANSCSSSRQKLRQLHHYECDWFLSMLPRPAGPRHHSRWGKVLKQADPTQRWWSGIHVHKQQIDVNPAAAREIMSCG